MTRQEREALIEANEASRNELVAAIAERREKQLAGELPWPDDDPPRSLPQRAEKMFADDEPPRELIEASHRRYIERLQREQQESNIVDLDPATQARWNAWADARIKAKIESALDTMVDATVAYVCEQDKKIIAELKALRAEMTRAHERDHAAIKGLSGTSTRIESVMSSNKSKINEFKVAGWLSPFPA